MCGHVPLTNVDMLPATHAGRWRENRAQWDPRLALKELVCGQQLWNESDGPGFL